MNEKSIIALESVKNDRTYSFLIPAGAPLGEAYDVLFEMLTDIIARANKAAENAKPQAKEEQPAETAVN